MQNVLEMPKQTGTASKNKLPAGLETGIWQ